MKHKRREYAAKEVVMLTALVLMAGAGGALAAQLPLKAPEGGWISYEPGKQITSLKNHTIDESSGVACSRWSDGILWTHNDSGGHPRVYAFDTKGRNLAACDVTGAKAWDWEDMASFKIGKKRCLLIADVGDNLEKRTFCTIYIIREPRVNPKKTNQSFAERPIIKMHFSYEDGAHNCESVGIDAASRKIILVEKCGGHTCRVYELPLPKKSSKKHLVARKIGTLNIPTTLAMDISSDGRRAVVLTGGDAYEYVRVTPKETWADAKARADGSRCKGAGRANQFATATTARRFT